MTILTMIDPARAEPRAKVLLDGVQKKLGVTPNLMRVLAVNPVVLGAYLDFSAALAGGRLGAKLHEQIALAVAEANGCAYCLAAHSLLGAGAGLSNGDIVMARRGAAGDPRAAAALAFALTLVTRRGAATAADIEAARRASLADAEIVEIIAAVAINIFTNYVNTSAGTEVDFPPAAPLPQAA